MRDSEEATIDLELYAFMKKVGSKIIGVEVQNDL